MENPGSMVFDIEKIFRLLYTSRMKKHVVIGGSLLGLTFAVSSLAVAQPPKKLTAGISYQQIKELFAAGSPIAPDEMTGWFAGRSIFTEGQPPMGSILVSGMFPSGVGGPQTFKTMNFNAPDDPAYYDTLNDSNLPLLLDQIESASREFPETTFTPKEATSGIFTIRKAGRNIVMRDFQEQSDGRIEAHYYFYFKRVTPSDAQLSRAALKQRHQEW